MLHLSICIGLLAMSEIVLASNVKNLSEPDELLRYIISHDVHASRTGRFGFSALDDIRKYFCQSFCTSADTKPYFVNLMCAVKCPELYLPHNVSTPIPIATTQGTPTTNLPITTTNSSNPNPNTQGTVTPAPPSSATSSTPQTMQPTPTNPIVNPSNMTIQNMTVQNMTMPNVGK